MGFCFGNSYKLMRRYPDHLHYAEGYAIMQGWGTPVLHGWCVDRESGNVVESTWAKGIAYLGVCIDPEYVEKHHEGETDSLTVLDNESDEFPRLRTDASNHIIRIKGRLAKK